MNAKNNNLLLQIMHNDIWDYIFILAILTSTVTQTNLPKKDLLGPYTDYVFIYIGALSLTEYQSHKNIF